jgi:hypothetical protein
MPTRSVGFEPGNGLCRRCHTDFSAGCRIRCATRPGFCGFPLDRETPNHASVWRFRQTIDELELSEALLAEASRQLDARGLMPREFRPLG